MEYTILKTKTKNPFIKLKLDAAHTFYLVVRFIYNLHANMVFKILDKLDPDAKIAESLTKTIK